MTEIASPELDLALALLTDRFSVEKRYPACNFLEIWAKIERHRRFLIFFDMFRTVFKAKTVIPDFIS